MPDRKRSDEERRAVAQVSEADRQKAQTLWRMTARRRWRALLDAKPSARS